MAQGMLGADTEALTQIGQRFGARGELVRGTRTTTVTAVDGVEWLGGDAEVFRADFTSIVGTGLADLADLLDMLQTDLEGQAAQQELASAGAGVGAAPAGPAPAGPAPAGPPGGDAGDDAPDDLPDDGELLDGDMDDASEFAYDHLADSTASGDFQFIYRVARGNPDLFNTVLSLAIDARAGDVWAGTRLAALSLIAPDHLAAAYMLYDNIQTGAPWDAKPGLANEFGQPLADGYFYLTDGDGNAVRSDVYGNVNYGAMLAHLGVDQEIAIEAANAGGSDVGVGDDPVDDDAVALGYEIYEDYPGGMSAEQYAEEIRDAGLY